MKKFIFLVVVLSSISSLGAVIGPWWTYSKSKCPEAVKKMKECQDSCNKKYPQDWQNKEALEKNLKCLQECDEKYAKKCNEEAALKK